MPKDTDSTIKFKADITDLKASMQEAGRYIRLANSEFKAATAGMNDWSRSADGLSAKTRQLNTILQAQTRQLNALEADYRKVTAEQGEDSRAAEELKIKINNQKAAIGQTQAQLVKYEQDLSDVSNETKKAGKAAEEAADGGFTVLKGAMANLVAQGISVALNGLRSLSSELINIGKQAVAGYADYEQLVGGVETLFGAGGMSIEEYADSVGKSVDEIESEYNGLLSAQDTVLKNAANAYRDVGMSANEYMDTVTSFSASLISSTGGDTERAAEAANAALIDMADNANKMGTNMASIQNAYQGFAKQNYMMLDNLKLGYGGTKSEMERLLADAEELSGVHYDISNLADVYEAIHVIQTEMGITGTTAKEAATTISGSTNMMKAAWSNLLTGMADDEADFGELLNNFIDSFMTMASNVLPRIKMAIGGIGDFITGMVRQLLPLIVDVITDELPRVMSLLTTLIRTVGVGLLQAMPSLVSTFLTIGTQVINQLGQIIPQIVLTAVTIVPQIIDALMAELPTFMTACINFLNAIVEAIPTIVRRISQALPGVIQAILDGLSDGIELVLAGAITLFNAIVDAIPEIIASLSQALPDIIDRIITTLVDAFPQVLDAAIELLMALIDAIPTIVSALVENLPMIINQIIRSLVGALPQVLDASITLLYALIQAIPIIINTLIPAMGDIVSIIIQVLVENYPLMLEASYQLLVALFEAIGMIVVELGGQVTDIIDTIVTALGDGWSSVKEAGEDLISGLWDGIDSKTDWIINKIQGFGEAVLEGLRDFFEIGSPAKLLRDEVGKWLPPGIAVGFEEAMPTAIKDMAASAKDAAQEIADEMAAPLDSFGSSAAQAKGIPSLSMGGAAAAGAGYGGGQTINFNQTINSPDPVNRLTVFRDTNSLLFSAGVRLRNV